MYEWEYMFDPPESKPKCPDCRGSGEDIDGDKINGFTRGPCKLCNGTGIAVKEGQRRWLDKNE